MLEQFLPSKLWQLLHQFNIRMDCVSFTCHLKIILVWCHSRFISNSIMTPPHLNLSKIYMKLMLLFYHFSRNNIQNILSVKNKSCFYCIPIVCVCFDFLGKELKGECLHHLYSGNFSQKIDMYMTIIPGKRINFMCPTLSEIIYREQLVTKE